MSAKSNHNTAEMPEATAERLRAVYTNPQTTQRLRHLLSRRLNILAREAGLGATYQTPYAERHKVFLDAAEKLGRGYHPVVARFQNALVEAEEWLAAHAKEAPEMKPAAGKSGSGSWAIDL